MPPSAAFTQVVQTLFDKDGIIVTAADMSKQPKAEIEGIVVTLFLHRHNEKNVINPTMISLLIDALDTIDTHPMLADTHNKALIVTGVSLEGGNDKFFSNGLDLEWMLNSGDSNPGNGSNTELGSDEEITANSDVAIDKARENISSNTTSQMVESFCSNVLARILVLPFLTIAAINGHCIGAGLFIALSCDFRIMRTERGFLQWPEARLGMRLSKGFAELSKAKVTEPVVIREGVLMAKKYTSREALTRSIIDHEFPIEELYDQAFKLAVNGLPESAAMKLDYFSPKGYTEIKTELYTDAYRALKFGRVEDLPHCRL
mmetsp:Transcript_17361/g.35977  ORF Transcript_17361/g.35977 Transcript_17361/m.35977 type:complete len:317 (+) Transcript_17361:79-1029(+)